MLWWLKCGDWKSKEKEVIDKNKCGGGIDLFITYVCAVKKKKRMKRKRKKKDMYDKREKKCVKKKKKMD